MGAYAAAIAGGISIIQGNREAQAKREQAEVAKATAEAQADFSEFQAEDAIIRGKEEERVFREKIKKTIGSQRVALAAQGIELDEGSALDVQIDTAVTGELDALTIKQNARREAFGFKSQALQQRTQGIVTAGGFEASARSSILSGNIRGGSSFIQGSSNSNRRDSGGGKTTTAAKDAQ